MEDETNFFDFDFSSSDADGSETFYVEIDEPANGTLGGRHQMVLSDLMQVRRIILVLPNPHFSGNISLAFKVFSEERFGSKISEGVEGNLTFTVVAVADSQFVSNSCYPCCGG